MTSTQLLDDIYLPFGGQDVALGYFSSANVNHAIARAIDKVLLAMSPNADTGNYTKQTITGTGAENYALATDYLRLLYAYVDNYEVTPVKGHDFRSIVANAALSTMDVDTTTTQTWYGTVTGSEIRIYPLMSASNALYVYYIARCDSALTSLETELAKVPIGYHEAVSAYAQVLLARKAKGQWNGDPGVLWAAYKQALSDGNSLPTEGFRDGNYPLQASGYQMETI